jgi:hypothetical protein
MNGPGSRVVHRGSFQSGPTGRSTIHSYPRDGFHATARVGRKRTPTPSIQVRILVPQPVDFEREFPIFEIAEIDAFTECFTAFVPSLIARCWPNHRAKLP